MKRIGKFITLGVTLCAGLVSCSKTNDVAPAIQQSSAYQVNFQGEIQDIDISSESKGLALVALPDWRNTDESHIHIFENGAEGSNPRMTIDANSNKVAYFSATFGEGGNEEGGQDEGENEDEDEYEDMDIDAPLHAPVRTKASDVYAYNAIIAPRNASGRFEVPSTQYPDTQISLIDPSADFLIGCTKEIGAQYTDDAKIKMNFLRPVSLFRFCIVNLAEGDKIQEIILTTDKNITGSFAKSDVNFDNGTASFNTSAGSNVITLKYDDADVKTIFYAHFVACPVNNVTIESLEVITDNHSYRKEFGTSVSFSTTKFNSWAVNMAGCESSSLRGLSFDFESKELIEGTYITLNVTTEPSELEEELVLTWTSSNPSVATVDQNGKVTAKSAGKTTITVTAPNGVKASLEVTVKGSDDEGGNGGQPGDETDVHEGDLEGEEGTQGESKQGGDSYGIDPIEEGGNSNF